MDDLQDLYQLLEASIVDEPPLAMKEGGIIKEGYQEDIDISGKPKQREKYGWQN